MTTPHASEAETAMSEPLHPDDDPRFAVAYSDYPGGFDAYWADYDAARLGFESARLMKDRAYVKRQAYYELRREVTNIVNELAREVGSDPRTVSIWLVRQHGFPWRRECDRDDLFRLRAFLLDPRHRAEAASIPPALPPRHFRGGDDMHTSDVRQLASDGRMVRLPMGPLGAPLAVDQDDT